MAKGIASALLVAALSIGGTAAADPASFEPSVDQTGIIVVPHHATGSWLDFGLLYGRVEPVAGTTISTEVVRFGPRAMINRFLYVGAEVDIGTLSGGNVTSSGATIARDGSSSGSSMTGIPGYAAIDGGTYAAGKALVGAQMMAGPLSGALEFSAGVRDLMTHDSVGQYGQAFFGGVYELHGRLDLWATRQVTIGGLASIDIENHNDVMFGVMAGFHFVPYDGHHR
jgi:hypothetical protein